MLTSWGLTSLGSSMTPISSSPNISSKSSSGNSSSESSSISSSSIDSFVGTTFSENFSSDISKENGASSAFPNSVFTPFWRIVSNSERSKYFSAGSSILIGTCSMTLSSFSEGHSFSKEGLSCSTFWRISSSSIFLKSSSSSVALGGVISFFNGRLISSMISFFLSGRSTNSFSSCFSSSSNFSQDSKGVISLTGSSFSAVKKSLILILDSGSSTTSTNSMISSSFSPISSKKNSSCSLGTIFSLFPIVFSSIK